MVNPPTGCLKPYLKKGQEFLKVDIPIICGAMSSISERYLVSAVANAGGLGVIAGGGLSPEQLKDEIKATSHMPSCLRPFYDKSICSLINEYIGHSQGRGETHDLFACFLCLFY